MTDESWLDRWLPLLRERSAGGTVLELGCGSGRDTARLIAAGFEVVAIDLSEATVALARERVPQARLRAQDLRDPWPEGDYDAVLASLSLHYFPWDETVRLMLRVHAALGRGGLLVCRLNSTRDHHFGASGHREIEPHYYDVDGEPKRFFDRAAVERLFGADWRVMHLEEVVIDRYEQPKVAWELIAEPA